jgi:DNA-directed RNA polymerase subunit RPC12/RpoP
MIPCARCGVLVSGVAPDVKIWHPDMGVICVPCGDRVLPGPQLARARVDLMKPERPRFGWYPPY